jgi:hypothetical protein
MAYSLDRSILSTEIREAVDKINDFLEGSPWKELHITSYGLLCVPKSGDTPSPPPAQNELPSDTPAEIRRKRKGELSAQRNAMKKKKTKYTLKTLQEIGIALQKAKEATPAQQEDPGTLDECFELIDSIYSEDLLLNNHMFGKRLRLEENARPEKSATRRMHAITEQFNILFPKLPLKYKANCLKGARRLYDITALLAPNQVQQIKGLTWWELSRIPKKNVSKILKIYK